MDEQPSLLREIGKIALLFAKILAAFSPVIALSAWLSFYHPLVGIVALYCFILVALIVFLGWQNYKSKLKDLEWRRNWEADNEQRRRQDSNGDV